MRTSQPKQQEPIAIVGIAGLFPGSLDVAAFWNNILRGTDLITDVPEGYWSVSDYYDADANKRPGSAPDKTYAKRGGFLPKVPFETLKEGIPPSLLPATDTSQLLALMVARTALTECFRGPVEAADRARVSCILGVTSGQELFGQMAGRLAWPQWIAGMRAAGIDESAAQKAADEIAKTFTPWSEASFPGLLGNVVAGRIANRLDLGGSNAVTDAACASSFAAISMGVDELLLGRADVVLTGGVDTLNDIFMYMCFTKTPALSAAGDCRPFDAKGDGTLLGEGLGMLALKRLSDAERDGNVIYATINGIGTSSDGKSKSVYAPVSEGQAKALVRAYEAAGYAPSSVELVEAHGTGTKAGDVAELGGLRLAFDDQRWRRADRQFCAIGSVKSQIGHTKSAAGAAGIIKAALALHEKALPPTIKVDTPLPQADFGTSPFYVNTSCRPWFRGSDHPRRAGVSSFGFGGSNWHITLEEYRGANQPARMSRHDVVLLALSASTKEALLARATGLAGAIADARAVPDLAAFCELDNGGFDVAAAHRVTFVASSREELKKRLEQAAAGGQGPGVFWGAGQGPRRVAFLFPGQGSQTVGMGQALALTFDDARAAWDAACDVVPEVVRAAHPPTAFTDDERTHQQQALTQTEVAQPALGVASLAALRVLRGLGVPMAMAAGHSFGELAALCAAGVFDEASLLRLARRRGELMKAAVSVPGAMAAVIGDARTLPALLAPFAPRVVIANENAPDQTVISGEVAALDDAIKAIEASGLKVKRLSVSTAFHSPLVFGACAPLREALDATAMHAPVVPVFSNTSAAPHGDVSAIRESLSAQVRSPVRFVDEVRAMIAAGADCFVEVGTGTVLTGLVGRIDARVPAVAFDPGSGLAGTFAAIAKLCALGVTVDLAALPRQRPLPAPVEPSKTAVMVGGHNVGRPALPTPAPARATAPAAVPATSLPSTPLNASKPTAPLAAPAAAPHAPAAPVPCMTTPPRTAPAPVAAAASRAASAPSAAWLQVFAEGQEQTMQAHLAFQKALAEAHAAYLSAFESTSLSLVSALGSAAPAVARAAVAAPVVAVAPTVAAPATRPVVAVPVAPVTAPVVAAPVRAAPAPVAPPPAPPPERGSTSARAALFSVVADKTGYPASALDDAMHLESDLGIDSIKRVEILGALKEKVPAAASLDALKLAQLATLGEIAAVLASVTGPAATPTPPATAPTTPHAPVGLVGGTAVDGRAALFAVVADKTGYPASALDDGMHLESDLGIDSIKRVEILGALKEKVPAAASLDALKLAQLATLGEIAAALASVTGTASQTSPRATAPAPAAASSGTGVDGRAALFAVVADKTGYPASALDDAMHLESDLGIDSIKRVEILGALKEAVPAAASLDALKLAQLATLGEIAAALASVTGPTALPATAPTTPAAPTAPGGGTAVDGRAALFAVVADKTGYPASALDDGMHLESDLGIDSIKRVEILGALKEAVPAAASLDALKLAQLATLGEIAAALAAVTAVETATPATAPVAPAAAGPIAGPSVDGRAALFAVVADKTGYPASALDDAMHLESDLGIDSIKRVEILGALKEAVPAAASLDALKLAQLATLGEIAAALASVTSVAGGPAPTASSALPAVPNTPTMSSLTSCPRAVVRLVGAPLGAASRPTSPVTIVTAGPRGQAFGAAVKDALAALSVSATVVSSVEGAVGTLVDLSSFDVVGADGAGDGEAALFGVLFRLQGLGAPLRERGGRAVIVVDGGGRFDGTRVPVALGLSGLAKTARQEWPEVDSRFVDLDARAPGAAQALARELCATGDAEVGLTATQRLVPMVLEAPVVLNAASRLQRGDVVVISGGARGVTATCALALARAVPGLKLALLQRTLAEPEPIFARGCADEGALKRAILQDAAARGQSVPLREVAAKAQQILSAREVTATLAALRQLGDAELFACDVQKDESVALALDAVRARFGPLTVVVHGAGVLADKRIEDKTPEQLQRVLGTKVNGLQALLRHTADDPLKAIVAFSSVAGRFGNVGQVDYSMANEAMTRLLAREHVRRPRALIKSLHWGPWAGGMVTPELKAQFAARGVSVIERDDGARAFVAELSQAASPDLEVVLGASLARGAAQATTTTTTTIVSSTTMPWLADHAVKGEVVLPVVVALDLLVQGAASLGAVSSLTGVEVLKGQRLPRFSAAGHTAIVTATRTGDDVALELRVDGVRAYRAQARVGVVDAAQESKAPPARSTLAQAAFSQPLYAGTGGPGLLFHGPRFHLIERLDGADEGAMAAHVLSTTQAGFTGTFASDVGALDAGLQLLLLWARHKTGGAFLPTRVGAFWQRSAALLSAAAGSLLCVLVAKHPLGKDDVRCVADVHFTDARGEAVFTMTDVVAHRLPDDDAFGAVSDAVLITAPAGAAE